MRPVSSCLSLDRFRPACYPSRPVPQGQCHPVQERVPSYEIAHFRTPGIATRGRPVGRHDRGREPRRSRHSIGHGRSAGGGAGCSGRGGSGRQRGGDGIDAGAVRVVAPIQNPEKILCIGLNYADHAAESNMPIPSEPVVFSKFSSTIIGPRRRHPAAVDHPVPSTMRSNWWSSIGTAGKDIPESDAMGPRRGLYGGPRRERAGLSAGKTRRSMAAGQNLRDLRAAGTGTCHPGRGRRSPQPRYSLYP